LKILVVEDNPDIKEVLDYILQDDGHEVIPCSDGTSLATLGELKPDIILMDDILSLKRGSEFCRQLKSEEATKDIPVILISAMPNIKDTAARCNADAYIEKPFNIDNLTEVIQSFAKK
jgi:DNA-binding response OmpR family regulator